MKYDDASWHYEGDFPEDLHEEAGGVHIGMFLAWAILNHLESDLYKEDLQASLEAVRQRRMTGTEFLFKECDGQFIDEDLNDKGNSFTQYYFHRDDEYGLYINDYHSTLAKDMPSIYHIKDTWENFDKLRPVIDQRYKEWKESRG